MENPIRIDDFGGPTPIFGNTHISTISFLVLVKALSSSKRSFTKFTKTFQVPKMKESSPAYISYMDTAYVKGSHPTPQKIAG